MTSARALARGLVNGTWLASCARDHARFESGLGDVADTQSRYLLDLLRRNADTCYGASHSFARIRSVAEYQERVPIVTYEDLAPSIDAIADGRRHVLTEEDVRLFQPTSGSTAATKLIPWTARVAAEFRRGIAPWAVALFRRRPELKRGVSYWSLSPPGARPRRHGRLPVGFDDDSAYLGSLGRRFHALVSASPTDLGDGSTDDFAVRTLACLLAARDLSLISIWSPTFLGVLLDFLGAHPEEALKHLRQRGRCNERRVHEVGEALRGGGEETLVRIWPNLTVISCWTHGPSALHASTLARRFPGVEMQGKGLVATEGFVSLPFVTGKDPVLAVTSHFFELQDAASGSIALAHEAAAGGIYRVIITTGGGLYRYCLGDLVEVTGFVGGAPCLRFLGREGNVSDLCGEKLNGAFVQAAVDRALGHHGIASRFSMVAPVAGHGPRYALFLSAAVSDAASLAAALDQGLQESFHYAHCRRIGQLEPIGIFLVDASARSAEACYQEAMVARGFKPGDIKPTPLDTDSGWDRRFQGRYVA
jgi:hypothetical protein